MRWLKDLPIDTRTDRDAETPTLLEFVRKHKPTTLLDVGAHHTYAFYAPEVRKIATVYDGIDILPDETTTDLLDNYIVGNANTHDWQDKKYDMVICVSTLEHAGLSTYKGDPMAERNTLFRTVLQLSSKHAWVSFPVGQGEVVEAQLETINGFGLLVLENIASVEGFTNKPRFFYSQGPQVGHPWREHGDRNFAFSIPYVDFIGNQSICVMELTRG